MLAGGWTKNEKQIPHAAKTAGFGMTTSEGEKSMGPSAPLRTGWSACHRVGWPALRGSGLTGCGRGRIHELLGGFGEGAAVVAFAGENFEAVAADAHFDGMVVHGTLAPGRIGQGVLVARLFRDARIKFGEG